ncbi:SRPBCC family protein [Streptomyces collinus]|uniref:SRPBCC family protein n=1 Tax=Streptomyces collinus TaxID=42684 RepID=UPI0029436670|nr:SRPBCC family protein [Streptomyces collinus]
MELHHEFTVPVPVDDAWHALLDIERVAPCLPGAAVESYDGKTVNGSVKVKVGPVTVTYRGTAVFEEQDEGAHRMVLVASGRETRGQGTARATVTGTLTERDGGTAVSVDTDLTVTGRPAQFGRGVLAEVGDRLVGRFAACLEERLAERPAASPTEAAAPPVGEGSAAPPAREGAAAPPVREEPEPLDLLRTAGLPVAKRVGAAVAAAAVLALAAVGLRRRGRTRSGRRGGRR